MKVKSFILTIFISLVSITLFAQKAIPLKEVYVYPPGYIKEVLEKVNVALSTNYETKKYFKYKLDSEAKINNNQIIEQLNTTTALKTNPLVFIYYTSKGGIRPQIIDSSFYKLHYSETQRHHKFLHAEMFTALGLDKKDFLTYNDKYEYIIKKIEDVIIIEFKSSYYCGTIKLNAINFNLISIYYFNDNFFKYSSKQGKKDDYTTISSASNYVNCSIRFKTLKNKKFVIESMNFDVEYQDYIINNLKDNNIKPSVFKKINTKIQMRLI